MDYVSSRQALFQPHRSPAVLEAGWPLDAQCAELSRLAYFRFEDDQRAELEQALAAAGFGQPALFRDAAMGAEAFATMRCDGVAFVAYRGTQADSLPDVGADARFLPEHWPGQGRVHRGFWRCCDSLRSAVDEWMEAHATGRLVVTGHSLGAAMATVTAALQPRAELVTFGSPRVGDDAFARQFEGRAVRRYVDCIDVVTSLPPAIGYRHVGGERYIDRTGAVHDVPPDAAFRRRDGLMARAAYTLGRAWRPGQVGVRGLADHIPLNYLYAILGERTGP